MLCRCFVLGSKSQPWLRLGHRQWRRLSIRPCGQLRFVQIVPRPAKSSAFAYLRTSSAANIGEDKDSGRRQLAAIQTYAKHAGIELAGTYHDEAVKGSDPIDARPGFAAMLEAIEGSVVRSQGYHQPPVKRQIAQRRAVAPFRALAHHVDAL